MKRYEIVLLSGETVVVEAECPSMALKMIRKLYHLNYVWDIKFVK